MKKFLWVIICFMIGVLAACQSSTSITPSQKIVSYNAYLFECTFQYPREWQVSPAFDSGGVVLMISDADPIEVFGFANRTGNEIVIGLFAGGDAKVDLVPANTLGELGREPITEKIIEFTEGDKQYAYVLNAGDLRAALVVQQKTFYFKGDYPLEKEAATREGMEVILSSLEVLNVEDRETLMDWPLGQRNEGLLKKDQTRNGSIPFWGISVWTFNGRSGQKVEISIDPGDSGEELMLDIFDQDGNSIMSGGALAFTGTYVGDPISLPKRGNYTIQISPKPFKNWGGWYEISLK